MSVNQLDSQWELLQAEREPGTYRRRLSEELPVYVTITNPGGHPGLCVQVPGRLSIPDRELRGSESFEVSVGTDGSTTLVTVRALNDDGTALFQPLAHDLVDRVMAYEDASAAGVALVRRFNWWQRTLKARSGSALSPEKQLGLFGELLTLAETLMPAVGPGAAVEAWTGPDNASQDFQIDGAAIEVKSVVHSQPQQLRIDGERQLDDFGLDLLLLAHHRLVRHEGAGTTLPEQVENVREALASEPIASQMFDEKLGQYGYWDDHASSHYLSTGYSVRTSSHYRVTPGFPRIVESHLQTGVGGVRYVIDASACERHLISEETVSAWLSDPTSSVDPVLVEESSIVEYKETAWTPTGDISNEKHRRSVVAALKTAVVKTVVGFLNANGGELVIGIRDDLTVAGIEPDLTERGREPSDCDWYQREMLTILQNQVDELVSRQVRITFDDHDGVTSCRIAVSPSPRPRFGRGFQVDGQARLSFWVRAENTTRELEGHDLVTYIDEQFRGPR